MNNGALPSPAQPRTIQTNGELLDQTPAVSHSLCILAYLWPQRCYWTESGPACRGPGTPLLCICPCLRHSMPLSLRASWLYNRWKMLKEVFRRGLMRPGAEKLRFGFGWTQIKVSPPGPSQNLLEPPAAARRRRTRLSNCRAIGDDVFRQ